MATPFLPGIIALLTRDDSGAAKRARDNDLLILREEADARGWSSSVLGRSLARRRLLGPASGSGCPTPGCGWVAAAGGEHELGCRCEEPARPDAVGAGTAAEHTETVSWFACFWNIVLAASCRLQEAAKSDLEKDPYFPFYFGMNL